MSFEIETISLERFVDLDELGFDYETQVLVYSHAQGILEPDLEGLMHFRLRNKPDSEEFLVGLRKKVSDAFDTKLALAMDALNAGFDISITSHQGGGLCSLQSLMLKEIKLQGIDMARVKPHLTCNYTTRDTWQYLHDLHGLGIRSVLLVAGDKSKKSHFVRKPPLLQGKDLVRLVNGFNDEELSGNERFQIYAAASPYKAEADIVRNIAEKLGRNHVEGPFRVDGFMTQPIDPTNLDGLDAFIHLMKNLGVHDRTMYSLIHPQSLQQVASIRKNPYRIGLSTQVDERLDRAASAKDSDKEKALAMRREGLTLVAEGYDALIERGVDPKMINFMCMYNLRRLNGAMERSKHGRSLIYAPKQILRERAA